MSVKGDGRVTAITLTDPAGARLTLQPKQIVFTAGRGNESLCVSAGLRHRAVRRPLHMLMARGPLPDLNGHCVDAGRTRVTITSDNDDTGRRVWQVGGQVAEDGVEMDPESFVRLWNQRGASGKQRGPRLQHRLRQYDQAGHTHCVQRAVGPELLRNRRIRNAGRTRGPGEHLAGIPDGGGRGR